MQTAFDVLVDPNRRLILAELRLGVRSTGQLAAHLGLSQPGTSRHLRTLREAGFVTVEPRAQQRIYSLASTGFDELDAWLQGYRRVPAAPSDQPVESASMWAEADADPSDLQATSRLSAGRSAPAGPVKSSKAPKSPKSHKKSAKSKAGKLRKPAKSGGARKP
ncbi:MULTISPECIES: helix-turn-helix transcriptional regulator [unclassified Cryobacterium]|uniref:ArsR/SmtB family transcription factor n=1 Tax=unclassified Cryobacterium TaxID=2649013 RepID=UPI00106C9EAB|nr:MULTISPECIES: metalloregulator ArsR/SmtB family transcription factor [unclassified Cryobacterium]TFB96294.1 ArsR family transcriptional regulator [Cryobacterium sp. MDB2-A-1]TFC03445.1 ArsR family transcriptional regulator [Cryobacterium sp. MDB2-33-2]TFC12579.1 ArsR family transcriptional regulator [Cryobacterium sp. MDB2-A-2]TFC16971.1 ArsR family transcriptional regulator [Cryobacterium sp. MDB2-10]